MTALARLDDEKRELLARTLCAGASRDEMELFFSVCDRTGLDPFARQIYAVKRWDSRAGREVMQTQVSIDGFRLVAQRSGEYAGQTSVAFCGTDGQWTDVWLHDEPPAAARVGVYRKGFVEAVTAVALFREYAQRKKDGSLSGMWPKMPSVMIAKCAEALALRKAFPAELSGLYTAEEMGQQDNPPVAPAPQSHVVAVLPAPVEAATLPQDAPAVADAPKPVRKARKPQEAPAATPTATDAPVAGPTDAYPDEYEGAFRIHRVVRRPGRAIAIEATGEHGAAWIATTVKEYADLAEESINGKLTMDVARVGKALTVMRVLRSEQPPAPEPAPVTDGSDLPF
jgi:phage recombination protein Bet